MKELARRVFMRWRERLVLASAALLGGIGSIIAKLANEPTYVIITIVVVIGLAAISELKSEYRVLRKERLTQEWSWKYTQFIEKHVNIPTKVIKKVCTYWLGPRRRDDRFQEEYWIQAFAQEELNEYLDRRGIKRRETKPIHFVEIHTTATGGEKPEMSWEELKLKAVEIDTGDELTVVPGGRTNKFISHVFFDKPIKPGDPVRKFIVTGGWPGMWDPLREHGEDWGFLDISEGIFNFEKIEIRIVCPEGVDPSKFDIRLEQPTANAGKFQLAPKKEDERYVFYWEKKDPTHGLYQYRVRTNWIPSWTRRWGRWVAEKIQGSTPNGWR